MNRALTLICFVGLLLLDAAQVRAAPARAAAATRPARILPQHQQALFFFGVYKTAADQIAADLPLPDDLHKKLSDRIAKGRADADAMLAQAQIPRGNGADAIQASAKISEQVNKQTRATVRDIRAMLDKAQYQAFDDRGRITMEEVLSLQVIKEGTDYVRRDVLGAVGLSGEQQRKMDALLKDNHAQMQRIMKQFVHRTDDGRGEYSATELAFKTRDAFRAILTPAQLKTWDAEILRRFGGKDEPETKRANRK
jgi:hypothetical protein